MKRFHMLASVVLAVAVCSACGEKPVDRPGMDVPEDTARDTTPPAEPTTSREPAAQIPPVETSYREWLGALEEVNGSVSEGPFTISHEDVQIMLPASLFEDGPYAVAIERSFETPGEERLLLKAESTYPARDNVVAAWTARLRAVRNPLDRSEAVWWWDQDGKFRVPFAVTAGAVQYYRDRAAAMRENSLSGIESSVLYYNGAIVYRQAFEFGGRMFNDCYIATLSFHWTEKPVDGDPLSFTKRRMVIMDANGQVMAIIGDGVQ